MIPAISWLWKGVSKLKPNIEELEDLIINPTDDILVCARKNQDGVNLLEVCIVEDWMLEDGYRNMYVHHALVLPEFPLCTAWVGSLLNAGEKENLLAVGSTGPSIEVWDLDFIDELEPCVVLGDQGDNDSHTDAVLGLSLNPCRNKLASASADKRVKIWDLCVGKHHTTMEHHSDKVQAVAWHHFHPSVLLSGSFDHTVVLIDGRMPSHSAYKWSVTADVESLAWDPRTEASFVVSLDDGTVKCFDLRTAMPDSTSELNPTFTLHAHDKAVTSVSYNRSARNLLATASTDKTVKLWDLSNNQPSCVASKTPKVGAVFSISSSMENPFLLAIGGSEEKLQVWDTLSDPGISQRYGNNNRNQPHFGA